MKKTKKEASLSLSRAISYPAVRFARSSYSPLRRFYTGMAHAGLEAGRTGVDLLPTQRWSLGAILGPHLSGMSDYEVAKALSSQLLSKVPKAVSGLSGNLSQIPSNMPYLLKNPVSTFSEYLKKLPEDLSKVNPTSPILRNVFNAVKHVSNPSPVVRYLQSKYSGKDTQHSPLSATVGYGALSNLASHFSSALAAGPETVAHAISPLITGATEALPEGVAGHLVSKGALNTFLKIKGLILGAGYKLGVNANSPLKRIINKGLSEVAYYANPPMAELAMMGTDIGNAVREAESVKGLAPIRIAGLSKRNLGIPMTREEAATVRETALGGVRSGREAIEKELRHVTHVPFAEAIKKDFVQSKPIEGLKELWGRMFGKKADFTNHHAFLLRQALRRN